MDSDGIVLLSAPVLDDAINRRFFGGGEEKEVDDIVFIMGDMSSFLNNFVTGD
jgi:hypothetical protein